MRPPTIIIFLLTSLFLAIFFSASRAQAQLQVEGPSPVYAGQKVSAVDLIGNPHRNLEPFRSVVLQKAGEPYSQPKIQESIEALQRAGHFSRVSVEVVPDLAGLRINFLLEPAYFTGVVEFPGAAQSFAYIRLLQVTNIEDEDPYDPSRVSVGEQALQEFFKRNGYFQSATNSEIQIDDAHQLVNVIFRVKLGKRARIGTVQIEGSDPGESPPLLHATRSLRARFTGGLLKPGKPNTAERMKDAMTLIKRALSRQNRLASSVEENPPQYHSQNNIADISFKVKLGPMVRVRATGAKLTWVPLLARREMRRLIPIYSERSLDNDLVQEGQDNLTEYFQKKGYFDVAVKVSMASQPDQVSLVYEIERGKKYRVERIEFHGNKNVAGADLIAHVAVKKAHFWNHGSVSQHLLKQSVSNLQAIYRDKGYEEAKISFRVGKDAQRIAVDFEIVEGAQTLIGNVNVTGNEHIPHDQLTTPKGFELRAGAPFSPRLLADDRNRISATYLDRGYPNADVTTKVSRHADDSHRVDVTYEITEHQFVRVGEVVYLGQQRTRLSLIEKTAKLPPESPVRKVQMLGAETRLYDLNIFDWSSVGPRRPITDQAEEPALVKVHESKRNDIIYGFGFEVSHRGGNVPTGTVAVPGLPTISLGSYKIAPSQATYASPRGSIEIDRHNMRGLGETASISLLLDRLDQRFLTMYAQPHFFGSQWSSLTSFSLERTTENPLFAATLGDASFQVERVISHKTNTRLQVRYDFNKTVLSHLLVPELVQQQDRNVLLSTFSSSLIRDTRDHPLDAHRGIYSTINFGITPTALGSSANYVRFFGQFATYKSVHGIVFANSIRLGMATAFSSSFIPTSQLFFSGGGNSLRGFPIDEAGPLQQVPFCGVLQNQSGCVKVTVPVGGNELFILNSELRFPLKIMKQLGGVIFYDGGNVYSAINWPNFAGNYTNTIGIGLRYSTPIGPIRFDLGYNLSAPPGITPTQYFITLGQAF
jgi:outer membrane protein insertion porin family